MREALAERALSLASLVIGKRQGVFRIPCHLGGNEQCGNVSVVGEGDGLATVGGATRQVAEVGTGCADRHLSHAHKIAQG